MENTKETRTSRSGYEEIAAIFSANAASLLAEDCIQHTLKKEAKRFENASALQISPMKFVGGNTARHCKELLRQNQPFFPLYMLSCLLMEGSMILLIYGLIFAGWQHLFLSGKPFTQPYPVIDGILAIAGFLLFQYSFRGAWMKELARTWDKPEQIRKVVNKKRCLSGTMILLLCAVGVAGVHAAGISQHFQMTVLDTLILYAACAVFAGVHNLIYDSHIIAFLSVGTDMLDPRKSHRSAESARHYINSALQQILGQKTPEFSHSQKDDASLKDREQKKAKGVLYSRLRSFRIYTVLAYFILLALDCLCIFQLLREFSPALLAFFLVSLLGTFLCFVVFLSCRTVLKELYELKNSSAGE